MSDLISERELARGEGWRIVAVKYSSDGWNAKEKVVLEPDAFVTSRELRESIPKLVMCRDQIRDAQGIDPDTVGPAFERLLIEWHEHVLGPKINKDLAEAINGHIQGLYDEHNPEAVNQWLDELEVSGEDRAMVGEWLTPDKVRYLLRNWRYRWRNAAINPVKAPDEEKPSE